MECSEFFLLLFLLSASQVVFVTCTQFQFQVGESHGWEVPPKHEMYNEWASKKRFKVDDTLIFSYKKNADSVMVVTEAEYERCHSHKPVFNSSDGDSVFKLDRPGLFYFISGISAHCKKGQKMIVKVLGSSAPVSPAQSPDRSATSAPTPAQTEDRDTTNAPTPTQNLDYNATNAPPPAQSVAMHAAPAISFVTVVISFLGVFLI